MWRLDPMAAARGANKEINPIIMSVCKESELEVVGIFKREKKTRQSPKPFHVPGPPKQMIKHFSHHDRQPS